VRFYSLNFDNRSTQPPLSPTKSMTVSKTTSPLDKIPPTLIENFLTASINNMSESSSNKSRNSPFTYTVKRNSNQINISDIDSKSFMSNVKIPLFHKDDFLSWYKLFQAQCESYKLKFRKYNEITNQPTLSDSISLVHSKTMNKLSEDGIIADSFSEAKDTLQMVMNGF